MRAYESVVSTSRDAVFVGCIDDDEWDNYVGIADDRERFQIFAAPRRSVVHLLNAAVKDFSEFDAYGLVVCDARIETPGWEKWLASAFSAMPGGIGVASACHNVSDWVNFPFVTKQWTDALGWFACPETHHYMWDTVLELLGEATSIRRATKDEFFIHHDHRPPSGPMLDKFCLDGVQFLNWCLTKRPAAAKKLREAACQSAC